MISNFAGICTKHARDSDKEAFKDWEQGAITTEECLKRFLNHNQCFVEISQTDVVNFALWLRSLGYIRRYKL